MDNRSLEVALLKIQHEIMDYDMALNHFRQEPLELIERRYHEKVLLPLKHICAMAENLEAALKDGYEAGFKV